MKATVVTYSLALVFLLSDTLKDTAALEKSKITFAKYDPTWESLDQRPIPQWFKDAKLGIFLHWGLYSVPAVLTWLWYEWQGPRPYPWIVQYMKDNYPPSWTYADFGPQFTAQFFKPDQWADIFQASGARYVVLTTKHHEGYCMWPSKYSWNWNSMDVGPKRDLVGELANSIRKRTDLKFGTYHSLFEFFHPLYLADKKNNFQTQDFVRTKTMPELYELVNQYKPEIIWSDGEWEANSTYWNSTHFLAWLYNESPVKDTVVTNDRWGADTLCKHGGYLTCSDKYDPGVIQKRTFEDATTMDKNGWCHRKMMTLNEVQTMDELTELLASVVSSGGNVILNVGPTSEGRIIPIFEERLRQLGAWLKVNGEAIYYSVPWIQANDTVTKKVWYTSKRNEAGDIAVYAIMLDWPESNMLTLGLPKPTSDTTVTMLGFYGDLAFSKNSKGQMVIALPFIPFNKLPCDYAWVLKIEQLANI